MTAQGMDGVAEILPLAPAQAGMLFDAVRGDAPPGSYIGIVSLALEGPLDIERLRAALEAAVRCRDATSVSFVWEGVRAPLQVLHKSVEVPFEVLDWSHFSETELHTALDQRYAEERLKGLDIRQAPLFRTLLIRTEPQRHILIWTIHHLVCDGWSMAVVIDDLLARYDRSGGISSKKPKGAATLRDYLVWRKSRDTTPDEQFWKAYLYGIEAPVAIATEAAPSDPTTSRLHRISSAEIDERLERNARELAKRLRVTYPTLLSAIWALLLRRFGAGDTVVFGQTSAGRPAGLRGIDRAVGAFVNTLPVRVEIDPVQPAAAFLEKVGAKADARRPHEFAALSDVQTWSGLAPGVPCFQTIFAYEGFPENEEQDRVLKVTDFRVLAPSTDALALSIVPGSPSRIDLFYDPAAHSDAVSAHLVREYQALLAALVSDPEQPVGSLASRIIVRPDIATFLEKLPPFQPVHQTINDWARKTPDAAALRCGADCFSFAELSRRAGALAAKMSRHGITRGDIVPLALDRSVKAVVAMLAVMRCGAAYTPVDLGYPTEHMAMIFDACKPKAILTTQEDAVGLPDTAAAMIYVEDEIASDPYPEALVRADDIAYVLFTSGSQGRPKGVTVTHGNLAYSTAIRGEVYDTPPRAFLVLSSLAFDSSVAGLYWALTTGAEAILSLPRLEQSMTALGTQIQRSATSHLLCLPALYQTMLDKIPRQKLAALDMVIVAGEPLPAGLIESHRRVAGRTRLVNEYGPTEATVWASVFDTAEFDGGADVPIGRGIPGTAIFIADPDGHPLPDGATGEIVIGGPGVAAGYLNDAAATTLAFLPAGNEDGPRLYRTGDLGLQRKDGQVLYRGRRDEQVKIRGHRIELIEIEGALRRLPQVADAAVIAAPRADTLHLVAFVAYETGEFDAARTRSALSEVLPSYMLPSAIHAVQDLPRLPNGKIDRGALSESIATVPPAEIEPEDQPQTFVETRLAEIWAQVLGLKTVARDASFFDLGGDSLKSIQAVFESEAEGLHIAPHEMFDYPILRDLAAHLQRKAAQSIAPPDGDLMVHLNAGGAMPLFLMIHGSPQMCSHIGQALGPDRPLAFQFSPFLRGDLDPRLTIVEMARELLGRLRALRPRGPYYLGGYSVGAVIAIELARMLRAEGEEVPLLFLLDPSWEMGIATDTGATGLARLRHAGKALCGRTVTWWRLAGIHVQRRLGHSGREDIRMGHVANTYRAALHRYRPRPYDGPVFTMVSFEVARALADEHGLAGSLTNRKVETLDFHHLDLQRDVDALFGWTTRLSVLIRTVEGEVERPPGAAAEA